MCSLTCIWLLAAASRFVFNMEFAHPAAFWALLGLPILVILKLVSDGKAGRATSLLTAPRLHQSLLTGASRWRQVLGLSLYLFALACFITALARPQWGEAEVETSSGGRSLLIGMDTSRSMLANDILPNRLSRAKLAASDLIKKLRGDRIGIIPFAGTAFIYAPITPDTDALLDSIDSLDTSTMPYGGSNLAVVIDHSLATFKKTDSSGQQALILFTDGQDLEGETLAAAQRARVAGMAITCVAIGTLEGGLIPDDEEAGGYFKDREGKVVHTRMNKETLQKVAQITGGLYITLDARGISDARLDVILKNLQHTAHKAKKQTRAIDRFVWPLTAGIVCLIAALASQIQRRVRATLGGNRLAARPLAVP